MEFLVLVGLPVFLAAAVPALQGRRPAVYWGTLAGLLALVLLAAWLRAEPGQPAVNHPVAVAGFFVALPLVLAFGVCSVPPLRKRPLLSAFCAPLVFLAGMFLAPSLGMGAGLLVP